jgi:hypothetical protein
MKEKWIVGYISPDRTASKACVANLQRICPEGKRENCFWIALYKGDPRLELLLKRLRDEGLQADGHACDSNGFFPLRIQRTYSRTDLDNSALLLFEPKKVVTQVAVITETGQVSLAACKLNSDLNIFALNVDVAAVTQEVREQMMTAGLRHVTFEPVLVTGKGAEQWQGKIWQLSSDLKLPKLSPKCKLVYPGRGGGPFDGDYSRWVMVDEEFHVPHLLLYRSSDLAKVEAFDLACPFERLTPRPYQKYLIASQRFYRFCRDHGYPLSWWPVCIDPD